MSRNLSLAALAAVLVAGCGTAASSRPPTRKPVPKVTTIAVRNALTFAPDPRGTWVLTLGGQLQRIDAATNQPGPPLQRASAKHYRDNGALVRASDTLWIADERNGLLRLDAQTGKSRGTPLKLGRPVAVAAGAGALWVADATNNAVVRVNPHTLKASKPIHAGDGVRSVTADDDGVWAVDQTGAALASIDPKTLKMTKRAGADSGRPGQAAAAADGVWMADDDGATLFDVRTLAKRGRWKGDIGAGTFVAADADSAWAVSSTRTSLYQLDPADARVLREIPLPHGAGAIGLSPHQVWIADPDHGAVYRVDR